MQNKTKKESRIMKRSLLEQYDKVLERLENNPKVKMEMVFNLLNTDNKEELEELIVMKDEELIKALSD